MSSNPVHGEVHSKQYYVIKFVSDLRQVNDFLQVVRFPPPIKLDTCCELVTDAPFLLNFQQVSSLVQYQKAQVWNLNLSNVQE